MIDEKSLLEARAKVMAGAMLSRAECTLLLDEVVRCRKALALVRDDGCECVDNEGCSMRCVEIAREALA